MNTQSGARPAAMEIIAEDTRYEGVGHSLRVVRERRGVALADVSSRLRIRRPYLEAIEAGRFDELPGAVYITGFLRQYAEFLGLDAEQVLKTYQDEADASLRRPVLNFPMPRPEQRTPPIWLVVGALLVAGAIYALWYNYQAALRFGQELVEAVPPKLAELIPGTQPIAPAPSTAASIITAPPIAAPPIAAPSTTAAPSTSAPATAAPNAAPAASAAAPSTPAPTADGTAPAAPSTPLAASTTPSLPPPGGAAAPATPAPAAASVDPNSVTPAPAPSSVTAAAPADGLASTTGTAGPAASADQPAAAAAATDTAAAEAAPAKPATYGALPGESRVQLEATAPAWIQVRGPNNEQIFTRLLNTGERYLVPDKSGLTLLTGNAGGLRIIVDGQALPPLGGSGEVKRGIALDPDRLKAAPAAAANQG